MSWSTGYLCSLYFFIFLFFATGIAETSIISYILIRRYSIRYFASDLRMPIFVSYLLPVFIGFATFFGFQGLKKFNHQLIKFFSILTAISCFLTIGFCLWIFIEKQELGKSILDHLSLNFHPNGDNKDRWDELQTELNCCGVQGPVSYIQAQKPIPMSCCLKNTSGSFCSGIQQTGCLFVLSDALSDDFVWVSLSLLISAIIQFPGVILMWKFPEHYQKYSAV